MNTLQLLDILKLGESEDLECKSLKMKFLNHYGIHIQQWLIQTGVLYY